LESYKTQSTGSRMRHPTCKLSLEVRHQNKLPNF
jgi:hypothetical protein